MRMFEISYSADWQDNCKAHTHDKMLLEFIVIANDKEAAMLNVISENPKLIMSGFEMGEEISITGGCVYLASNESYDM